MRDRPDIDIDDLQEIQCEDGVARWACCFAPHIGWMSCFTVEYLHGNFCIVICRQEDGYSLWRLIVESLEFDTEQQAWQYLKDLKR